MNNKQEFKELIESLFIEAYGLSQKDMEKLFKILKKYLSKIKELEEETPVDDEYIKTLKDELANKILDWLYDRFEEILADTLEKGKKYYTSWKNDGKPIHLEEYFYNKDGKTLPQRVKRAIENSNNDPRSLLPKIGLIADTEAGSIVYNTLKEKTNTEYVEVDGDDCCGECSMLYGIYQETNAPDFPFHPGCHCFAYPIELGDVLLDGDLDEGDGL